MNNENNTVLKDVVIEKLIDAEVPGFEVEFDPDEAEIVGAFTENALTEEDAKDSAVDLVDKDEANIGY